MTHARLVAQKDAPKQTAPVPVATGRTQEYIERLSLMRNRLSRMTKREQETFLSGLDKLWSRMSEAERETIRKLPKSKKERLEAATLTECADVSDQ